VLCGHELLPGQDCYSYAHFLHEADKDTPHLYCRECREILRANHASGHSSKMIKQKVKVNVSDYHLPGFILSKDGMHYVRKNYKKREKRCSGGAKEPDRYQPDID
jgi:hypothetical protein